MTQQNPNIIAPISPAFVLVQPDGRPTAMLYDLLTQLWTVAPRAGRYIVTAADVLAGTTTISTGLVIGMAQMVQILRGGRVATSDAAVALTGGNLMVGSGGTYVLTAGDVINWIVIGQGRGGT